MKFHCVILRSVAFHGIFGNMIVRYVKFYSTFGNTKFLYSNLTAHSVIRTSSILCFMAQLVIGTGITLYDILNDMKLRYVNFYGRHGTIKLHFFWVYGTLRERKFCYLNLQQAL
jgi:hypothetical protein